MPVIWVNDRTESRSMLRLTDLREILRYVPRFRDKVFVIALDGAIVEDDNFGNLLLDIVLLRSLRIGVVLVHGAGQQIEKLAEKTGQKASNLDGTGVTDAATLQLALTAANRVSHEILEGLAANDLRGAVSNAIVAHPAGILQGIDYQLTGRVERVDTALLHALLANDVVPVVPPLGCDGEGHTFRVNSDAVAVDVAQALHAVKLIYLTIREGVHRGDELLRHVSVDDAETILKKHAGEVPATDISKLANAVKAAQGGVPRVHIIDGRVEEGLLAEVFSNEGIGTLVHANEYQAIRKAHKKDARVIFGLMKPGMENDEFLRRTRAEIERTIDDYYLFDVDRTPVACVAIHFYTDQRKAEMASLCVDARYENQGIGARLMQYAEALAKSAGVQELFCLSTQAYNYFQQKGGYQQGTPDDLPPPRRERYDKSGRRSMVLVKKLT
jgi:amino-acid N-acetyltransferase